MVAMAVIPACRYLLLRSEACLAAHALSQYRSVLHFEDFCVTFVSWQELLPPFEHDAHSVHMAINKNSMPSLAAYKSTMKRTIPLFFSSYLTSLVR